MKLGDTIFNGNQFKNVILNSVSYKRLILGTNLVWSYFSIAIKSFKTRIIADGGTYEAESILEDRLQEITPNLFDSASLVITPNGVKTSKLYTIKPNDGTGDLTVVRATTATRVNESGVIVDVPANVARIDYSNGSAAILSEPQRRNLVYPSDIATTQVRAVTAQIYTLSFYGSGSVVLSGAYGGTLNGTGSNNRVSLTFTPIAGNLTLTVSGSVTNWQLEAGSNATSFIKTTTGSVTINADVISKTDANTLIGQTEGTVLIKGMQTTRGMVFRLTNRTSTNNSVYVFNIGDYSGRCEYGVRKNGVSVSTASPIAPNLQSNKNIIIKYSQTTIKVFINGVLFWTYNYPTSTDFTAILDKIEFGSLSEAGLARFDLVAVWKTQITDAQAIQLTTL